MAHSVERGSEKGAVLFVENSNTLEATADASAQQGMSGVETSLAADASLLERGGSKLFETKTTNGGPRRAETRQHSSTQRDNRGASRWTTRFTTAQTNRPSSFGGGSRRTVRDRRTVNLRGRTLGHFSLRQSLLTLKTFLSARSAQSCSSGGAGTATGGGGVAVSVNAGGGNCEGPARFNLSQSMLASSKVNEDPWSARASLWLSQRLRQEAQDAPTGSWGIRSALKSCLLGAILFVSVGLWLLANNDRRVECRLNYEEYSLGDGGTRYECIPITSEACGLHGTVQKLEAEEILVFYELQSFNQNDSQVLNSRSDRQLAGEILTNPKDVEACEPFATKEVDGVRKVLHPCGALAWRVFNDSFLFFDAPPDTPAGNGAVKPLPLLQAPKDILGGSLSFWKSKFKNPSAKAREAARDKVYFWMSVDDNEDGREGRGKAEEGLAWSMHEALNYAEAGSMVENAHFMQWMVPAALPSFRKLYGKLKGPLSLPLYAYITINYDVQPWGGRKALILTVPAPLGKSLYLGIAFLVFGSVLFLLAVYFAWRICSGEEGRLSRRLNSRPKRKKT